MKLKNIFLALGGAMLLSCSMASCSDEEEYDFDGYDYTRIYFANANTLTKGSVSITKIGNFSNLEGKKTISATAPTTKGLKVNVEIDYSLVETYNNNSNKSYSIAPDGVFSLNVSQVSFESGSVTANEYVSLEISENGYEKLQPGIEYLVPVRITSCDDAAYHPSSNVGYTYFLVLVSSNIINDEGTVEGLKKLDKTGWLVTTDDDKALNLQSAIDDNDNSYAQFPKGNDVTMIFDIGEETKFKAIELFSLSYIYGFMIVTVDYSLDGDSWTELCTLNYNRTQFLTAVLYGSLSARYIRLNGNFYFATYPAYCRLYEFSLYN